MEFLRDAVIGYCFKAVRGLSISLCLSHSRAFQLFFSSYGCTAWLTHRQRDALATVVLESKRRYRSTYMRKIQLCMQVLQTYRLSSGIGMRWNSGSPITVRNPSLSDGCPVGKFEQSQFYASNNKTRKRSNDNRIKCVTIYPEHRLSLNSTLS